MKKIVVIGAGIFGCSIALELSKNKDLQITLIEREKDILSVATSTNLLRHHYGYHYPRSEKTAEECIAAKESFEKEYGECIIDFFPSYYAVAKEGSKSTPEEFLSFCDKMNLPYEVSWPEKDIIDRSKAVSCIKTPEPIYDPDLLKKIVYSKIKKTNIEIKLSTAVIAGEILDNGKKRLTMLNRENRLEEDFDYVVAALYSNYNQLNKWFNFKKDKVRYSLFEVLEIELPIKNRVGMIIVDGNYSAILPNGNKNNFRLANAGESVIQREISDDLDDSFLRNIKEKTSNKEEILKRAENYFPIVKKAKVLRSIYIIQVVKAGVENTDERPSEIDDKGKGIYSVFSGKVISCIEVARKISKMLS